MTKRLVKQLEPVANTILDGAKVTAVGTDVVTIDASGATITNVPYLGTGWKPAVNDVVSVLIYGNRALVLGPAAPNAYGGSPFAIATGTVSVSVSAAASGTASVTFPASRFTQAPVVTLAAIGTSVWHPYSSNTPSTSGFTAGVRHIDNTSTTATVTVHWVAVQMTPSSATG